MNLYPNRSFTLLELVIVLTILAALAGSLLVSLGTSSDHAEAGIRELRAGELREALRRFRADTGYFPGEGLFAPDTTNGVLRPASPPAPFANTAEWEAWLTSPANLLMLIRAPATASTIDTSDPYAWALIGSAEPLVTWSPERRRGWRGPYLRAESVGWVELATQIDQSGALNAAPSLLPVRVPALSNGQSFQPLGAGQPFAWWSAPTGDPRAEVLSSPQGRPLYLLNVAPILESPGAQLRSSFARLVSSGDDGVYVEHALLDTTPPGQRTPAALDASGLIPVGPYSDDFGLFLVR